VKRLWEGYGIVADVEVSLVLGRGPWIHISLLTTSHLALHNTFSASQYP
jgi:hypothetical protein